MKVIVVYAGAADQHVLSVELADGATVEQAIVGSGVLALVPELRLESIRVGIWNRNAKLDTVVRDGDRVEIYRPLVVDPKEARRIRAQVRQRRR
jgi:putative ubiquitin-RnfH superfamily antitoxin RatB of RatAB toxin-antitoxin module